MQNFITIEIKLDLCQGQTTNNMPKNKVDFRNEMPLNTVKGDGFGTDILDIEE